MMERKNTVTVKSFELGLSSLLDARSKTLVVEQTDFWNRMGEECNYQVTENSAASVLRDIYRRNLLPMVEKQKKTYDVKIERKKTQKKTPDDDTSETPRGMIDNRLRF